MFAPLVQNPDPLPAEVCPHNAGESAGYFADADLILSCRLSTGANAQTAAAATAATPICIYRWHLDVQRWPTVRESRAYSTSAFACRAGGCQKKTDRSRRCHLGYSLGNTDL